MNYEIISSAFKNHLGFLNEHIAYNKGQTRRSYETSIDVLIQTARGIAMKLEQQDPSFKRVGFLMDCGMTTDQLKSYGEVTKA